MIDHLEIARVPAEVERACVVAAAVGAHVVGTRVVTTVFFALANMPAVLGDVGQLLAGVDRNTGLVGRVGLVGLVVLAVESDEVRPACLEPLECYTLMESVAGRHSRWQLGGLG